MSEYKYDILYVRLNIVLIFFQLVVIDQNWAACVKAAIELQYVETYVSVHKPWNGYIKSFPNYFAVYMAQMSSFCYLN